MVGNGSKNITVRSYQRSFELLLQKQKIPHHGFHALRHTFATRAIECGMDVKSLSEILGHKNPTITLKRYVHSFMEHKREFMNRLGKLIVLFAFILCAVPIYIYCGFKNEPYAFLDKNIPFELEYGVKGMVTERKKKFRDTYIKFNIIAACVCIFSPIPLIISGFTENELLVIMMLAVMMIVAGIGASIFIVVGVQNASMQKLLKEGEFTEKEKKRTSVKEAVGFAYWGVLTAIFFIWGFLGNDGSGIQGNSWISWRYNWIVFAVGGILFPIVMMLCNLIADKDKKD